VWVHALVSGLIGGGGGEMGLGWGVGCIGLGGVLVPSGLGWGRSEVHWVCAPVSGSIEGGGGWVYLVWEEMGLGPIPTPISPSPPLTDRPTHRCTNPHIGAPPATPPPTQMAPALHPKGDSGAPPARCIPATMEVKKKKPKYLLKCTVLGRPKTVRFESYVATPSDVASLKWCVLGQLMTVNETLMARDFIVVLNDQGINIRKEKT
jgi:hypothetical protein